MADPCTKCEVSSASRCGDTTWGAKFYKGSHDTDHAPFREDFFIGRVGLAMVPQCTKFEVSRFSRYVTLRCNLQKMGWFGAVRGHSRSRAMPPFDRAHTTSYSTLIEILYRFRDIACYLSKVADFDPPHLQLAPRRVWSRSNFAEIFGTRSPWAIVLSDPPATARTTCDIRLNPRTFSWWEGFSDNATVPDVCNI